jgi:hypothetical protein
MVANVIYEVMYIIWYVLLEGVARYVLINLQRKQNDIVYYRRSKDTISILLIENLGTK